MSKVRSPAEPWQPWDLLVVGGGINGAGIARDAAGRGWRVLLVEQDDLAAHTSSASTKLIHGGLRYLEHGDFGLVRKALAERERLLASAPHLIRPLRLVIPHDPAMRPAWMIRLGLWFYDHLAKRGALPPCRGLNLRLDALGGILRPELIRGFEYSDGWTDDARLVLAVAMDARERGAEVRTRVRCTAARRRPGGALGWAVELRDADGDVHTEQARVLVNAAGPWAADFLAGPLSKPASQRLRRVRGSHIVIRRRMPDARALLLQAAEGRVLFMIPYEGDFTLIGTTEVEVTEALRHEVASAEEIAYLCAQTAVWLREPVRPEEVVWHYAGVRPLLDDGEAGGASALTRDYRLDLSAPDGAPLLTVWGGKLTTFRCLAEEAVDKLGPVLGDPRPAWTARAKLPGAETERDAAIAPWLPPALRQRLASTYGSRLATLLGSASGLEDLGVEVAPGLFERELHYLMQETWVRCAEDVLWRRTKLGLHLSAPEREQVALWFQRFSS
ncbi:MAG: glycerol-3-phosphate dehydrogenase [Leptothrix ochracea]|uniref:glycerol-3-phosphate dehydrogenase n=1 Tax=Leptothrix ochracea TaxID=735331 RepID=UPI0034E20161